MATRPTFTRLSYSAWRRSKASWVSQAPVVSVTGYSLREGKAERIASRADAAVGRAQEAAPIRLFHVASLLLRWVAGHGPMPDRSHVVSTPAGTLSAK